jgi:hypothetical protein
MKPAEKSLRVSSPNVSKRSRVSSTSRTLASFRSIIQGSLANLQAKPPGDFTEPVDGASQFSRIDHLPGIWPRPATPPGLLLLFKHVDSVPTWSLRFSAGHRAFFRALRHKRPGVFRDQARYERRFLKQVDQLNHVGTGIGRAVTVKKCIVVTNNEGGALEHGCSGRE